MKTVYIIANNFSPYTNKIYGNFADARDALRVDNFFRYIWPDCRIYETTQELIDKYWDEIRRDSDLYCEDEDTHQDLFNRSFTVVKW